MKYQLFIALVIGLLPTHTSAGTLSGTVYYEGVVPQLRSVDMSADPACMHHQSDDDLSSEILVLGKDNTLGNVFVEVVSGLDDSVTYPVPDDPIILTQAGCRYAPRVFGIRVGQTLQVLNPDGTLHNVNGLPKVNRPFNRAMPRELDVLEIIFEHAEPIFPIRCDVHPWMASFCAVLEHPFYDVTSSDGTFKIDNLPPGNYELRAWHERLGEQIHAFQIEEEENSTAEIKLVFKRQ